MANERGRLTKSNGVTQVLLNDAATKTKIISEEIYNQTPVSKLNLPLTSSTETLIGQIQGRIRTITVEGIKIGTQTEQEAFMKIFDDWSNVVGIPDAWHYYPLFHPDNTAGSGSQNKYFNVLPESVVFRTELRDVGYVLHYTLILVEGVDVR